MTVTIGNAVSDFFKRYATFSGRSTRSQYWFVILVLFIVNMLLTMPGIMVGAIGMSLPFIGIGLAMCMNILGSIIFLALLIPMLALTVRRLHDIGRSGAWLLLFILVPFISAVMFVLGLQGHHPNYFLIWIGVLLMPVSGIWGFVWMCTPGDDGPNEYGPSILDLPEPGQPEAYMGYPPTTYPQNNYPPVGYPQNQYNPYGQGHYGQNQYGQPQQPQAPYGQNPYGGNPYNANPYGNNPYSAPDGNAGQPGNGAQPGQFRPRRPGQFGN